MLHRGFPAPGAIAARAAATIGSFDGVHIGHQALLRHVAEAAGAAAGVLVTFDPHPRCVVDPKGCPPLLTAPADRAELARRLRVTDTVVLEFTRALSQWSAETFCDRLCTSLALHTLVIGPGFALGHGRTGDESFLRAYGAKHGFDVVVVPPVTLDGAPVSSRRVRSAVMEGRMTDAIELLGRPYRLAGNVVHGNGRGRSLGFPTANLDIDSQRCMPEHGVYATWFSAGDRRYPAATSVGIRPTFDESVLAVESHLLDVDIDLYGRQAHVDFVSRLRDEERFDTTAALVEQIGADVDAVRTLLRDRSLPEWPP
ncbi:MAG: bifunctional riboflavin kinase/FAD synthetase [Candidatus Dormibacteraeota bacterium]|nr:bifunctional riboflavin kinase/FAD synthetase [Candidatus Dormibacteraeota bacterium]